MRTLEPSPVPSQSSPYWVFYELVAAALLADWMPAEPSRIVDLSADTRARRSRQLRDAGHDVLRVGTQRVDGVQSVDADARSLAWLQDASVDAVVAESRALSLSLAAEETVRDLQRVLRPGGRLLLEVDSLPTGLAQLAHQEKWAELADVPSADVVLVPSEDGTITRCFWPEEVTGMLTDAGLAVDWVRTRTVLTAAAVEQAVASGGEDALRALISTEQQLSEEREGQAVGLHLVASASKPG